jgi:hypothetical protein
MGPYLEAAVAHENGSGEHNFQISYLNLYLEHFTPPTRFKRSEQYPSECNVTLNDRINVTWERVPVTTVAVEKQ